MYLQNLRLSNFKNYEQAEMEFSEKVNCFIGNNGAGKTNILDAVYYLAFCKSYFNQIDNQNIKHNEEYFAIHGIIENQDQTNDKVSCIQKRGQNKVFKYNDKTYSRLADHIGKVPLVMISPYDRDLINDGSELRRKYLNGVISQFNSTYLDSLLSYNKALQQRNTLLKHMVSNGYFDLSSLEIWDEILSAKGKLIYEERNSFIRDFNPVFENYYQMLSGGKENVSITYESQLERANLKSLLLESVERDRFLKYTSKGIHKDDLIFNIGGYPIKKFGSQGQQKSFVIAIKLAQFEFMRKVMKFKPILLFDDIFDKLDDTRVHQIIDLVSNNNFGQVFITDTQRQRIENIFKIVNIDHHIFDIDNGFINIKQQAI